MWSLREMRSQQAMGLLASTLLFMTFTSAAAWAQAFSNAPARPATAAAQMARETHEARPEPVDHEPHAERAMEAVKSNEASLYAFLRLMPKGGDLHNHLSGETYAESFVRFAIENNLCIDKQTEQLSQPPCVAPQVAVATARQDMELYQAIIDAWSMRGARRSGKSGHDHFFDTFGKFGLAERGHTGEMLAEASARAAEGRVTYLELMISPDEGGALALGKQAGFDENFGKMREKMLAAGLPELVAKSRANIAEWNKQRDKVLGCEQSDPRLRQPGCHVTVRYLHTVLRAFTPEQVFAQLLLGFELANAGGEVVGLNMVQPEDWLVPMDDFRLHMRMVEYLHEIYPKAHISLHAGELAPGLVPPEGLRFHIRESVEKGHAERIGHGVDVMYEDNPEELLSELAKHDVMIEICLTSNDGILGVRGRQHPLWPYLRAGVPVALATDDEGVSRSEMTREYERAVTEQGVDYLTLKKMARNSLEYSFLPGASLWADNHRFVMARECTEPVAGNREPSAACRKFLSNSEKAREQWRLEKKFAEFEAKF